MAPKHKCIGFVVSSVAVSSLAASIFFFEPSSNGMFEPVSNRFSERVFERDLFELVCSDVSVFECFRTLMFELVFLIVSVFARIFKLVFLNVSVFGCFRTLVFSR